MADKELKIKLAATGGDAAAAEVEKLTEATEALNQETAKTNEGTPMFDWGPPVKQGREEVEAATVAVEDLGKTVTEAAPALEKLTDAANDMSGSFNMGGKASEGLGSKLIAMAGGPFKIILASFAAGVAVSRSVINHLAEIEAAASRSMPTLASTSQAAAIEAEALAIAEERLADAIKQNDTNVAAYTSRLRALSNEQAGLVDAELGANLAQIDLDELQGNLTEAEAITARYQARLAAGDRKLALEREQLETELRNQQQQNALELARLREVSGPAAEAQGRQARLEGRGASSVPELADQVAARNAAIAARAQATTTDPEELDALDAAITETQETLAKAYEDLVAAKAEEVKALVAKVEEASSRVSAGNAAAADLEAQLGNLDSGPAAQAAAARRREQEIRMQTEMARVEQAAEAERQKAAAAAAAESARAAADASAREAAAMAARMGGNATANGGVPGAVVGAIDNAAAKLSDGTTEQEIAGVMARIVTALEGAGDQKAQLAASLAPLMQRLQNVESQLKNNR
jgi:hypothetical protein